MPTTTDVIKSMDGIGANPGLFIRAPDYVCQGTEIVYNSAYFEGKAVRGLKVGQRLFETPWFAAGTLNNVVIPMVYIEGATSVTGTGTDASTQNDKIKIIIHKRLPSNPTAITTTNIFVSYHSNVSNKIGQAPHTEHWYRPSWYPTWFDIRYEYKFVVEVYSITDGAALDVEGIYFQYYVVNTVTTGRQLKFGSYGETTLPQGIPVILGCYWTATTDGAGNLSIAIPSEYFPYSAGWTMSESATGSAPSTTTVGLRGFINAVDSVQVSFVAGTDINNEYLLWTYEVADSYNGGYTIYVGMHSDNPSTQYWFYSQIFGYCGSVAV